MAAVCGENQELKSRIEGMEQRLRVVERKSRSTLLNEWQRRLKRFVMHEAR